MPTMPEAVTDRRNEILQAIAQSAAALVAVTDWRAGIDGLLARLGNAAGISRVYLFEVHEVPGQGLAQTCRHDWAASGLAPLSGDPRNVDEKLVDADPILMEWTERRRRGELIQGLTRDLTGYLREDFEYQRILSFVSIPIMVDGRWWGHLGFDDCEAERLWSDLELDVLKTAAALISGAVERSRAAGVLRASEALKGAMLQTALDCIITIDETGRVVEFNPAAESTFGWPRHRALGRLLGDIIVPPETRASHQAGFDRYMATSKASVLGRRIEVEGMRADGSIIPLELAITEVPVNGRRFFTAFLRDITERQQARARLTRLAYHDTATGLPNRELLIKRMAEREPGAPPCWIVALELLRFGLLKISLGTEFADTLLCALTERLAGCLGPDAQLARTGDRQFAVLGTGGSGTGGSGTGGSGTGGSGTGGSAEEVARRLDAALHAPFHLEGRTLFQAASYGFAGEADQTEGTGTVDPEALLRNAELACERALEAGGGLRRFDEAMRAAQLDRLALEAELRHALDDAGQDGKQGGGQIWVAYQPIVLLPSRTLAGFEALVRWRHPTRGPLSPLTFIPIAEVTGLIVPLGHLVLREACRQMAAWAALRPADAHPLFMSINLSARQLADPGILETVRAELELSGVDPACVKLELTETTVMTHAGETIGLLNDLKALGLRLSIDDFGTGYSSLSYLHQFPVDTLKVDQSFVSGMCRSAESRDMVRIIVDLAHLLKLEVVAEGIETAEDAEALAGMACGFGQGYLFSRPLDALAATELVTGGGAMPV